MAAIGYFLFMGQTEQQNPQDAAKKAKKGPKVA
jgi:hypothetical protein